MFQTSHDFLNIALGSSIALLAIVSCWAIYYFARILQQGFKAIKEMRERFSLLDELLRTIKDKIEHSTSHIALIAEGVKKLLEMFKEKTSKRKTKANTTNVGE